MTEATQPPFRTDTGELLGLGELYDEGELFTVLAGVGDEYGVGEEYVFTV